MKSLNNVKLSMLDLVAVREGATVADALQIAVRTAQQAEKLGFTRYWLAEHHNMPGIASSATAVLIGHIAGATQKIRVGSGGIMLPNHAPLVVAEAFGTLAELYPGRIDLGLGRAPGTDAATMRALRRDRVETEEDFPRDVQGCSACWAITRMEHASSPCPVPAPTFPSGCWAPACSRHNWLHTWACPMPLPRTLPRACCTRPWPSTVRPSNPAPRWPSLTRLSACP